MKQKEFNLSEWNIPLLECLDYIWFMSQS